MKRVVVFWTLLVFSLLLIPSVSALCYPEDCSDISIDYLPRPECNCGGGTDCSGIIGYCCADDGHIWPIPGPCVDTDACSGYTTSGMDYPTQATCLAACSGGSCAMTSEDCGCTTTSPGPPWTGSCCDPPCVGILNVWHCSPCTDDDSCSQVCDSHGYAWLTAASRYESGTDDCCGDDGSEYYEWYRKSTDSVPDVEIESLGARMCCDTDSDCVSAGSTCYPASDRRNTNHNLCDPGGTGLWWECTADSVCDVQSIYKCYHRPDWGTPYQWRDSANIPAEICNDLVDNDCDGDVDCADSDCCASCGGFVIEEDTYWDPAPSGDFECCDDVDDTVSTSCNDHNTAGYPYSAFEHMLNWNGKGYACELPPGDAYWASIGDTYGSWCCSGDSQGGSGSTWDTTPAAEDSYTGNPPGLNGCDDGLDNDCDGDVDCADTDCVCCTPNYFNNCDNSDGCGGTRTVPAGYNSCDLSSDTSCGTDSDCDGIDDDCDGTADDNAAHTWYYNDDDNDGYGAFPRDWRCAPGGQYKVTSSNDCIDTNGNVNPGETEGGSTECRNQLSDECNSNTDYDTLYSTTPATTHGDNGCPVSVTAASASPLSQEQNGYVDVSCTSGIGISNAIFVYRDVDNSNTYSGGDDDCGWTEPPDAWAGSVATFRCPVGNTVGSVAFRCSVYDGGGKPENRAYMTGSEREVSVTVTASTCSDHDGDEGACTAGGCCYVGSAANPECNVNDQWGGFTSGSCISSGSCPLTYACDDTKCGAVCDGASTPPAHNICDQGICQWDPQTYCGDNVTQSPNEEGGWEDCDNTDIGTCNPVTERCDGACGCELIPILTHCGDGIKQNPNEELTGGPLNDGNESCDVGVGVDDCETIPGGFDGGVLACDANCEFDTSGCTLPVGPSYGNLSGWVNSSSTTLGIDGAEVSIVAPPAGFIASSNNGAYAIEDIPSGQRLVSASKPGYRSKTVSFFIDAIDDNVLNFNLSDGDCEACADWEYRCNPSCAGVGLCTENDIPAICEGARPGDWVLNASGDGHVLCCTGAHTKARPTGTATVQCPGGKHLVKHSNIVSYGATSTLMEIFVCKPNA